MQKVKRTEVEVIKTSQKSKNKMTEFFIRIFLKHGQVAIDQKKEKNLENH